MLIKLYYDNSNIIVMKLCVINEAILVAYTLTEKFSLMMLVTFWWFLFLVLI